MTILDICIELYKWFQTNDSLNVKSNFKDIFLISENEATDKATLIAGLKKLEEQKVITEVIVDGQTIFILNQKLESLTQDVALDRNTTMKIATVINNFCDSIDDHMDIVDPSNIRPKDVLHLALIMEAMQKEGLAPKKID